LVRWPDAEVICVLWIDALQIVQKLPQRPVRLLNKDSIVVDGGALWLQ
jgi:hypothetical protein